MSVQYLLVKFTEQRAILADGELVGITNHTLMLPADEYTITIDGGGYTPASQDVVLAGTSLVRPMVIVFAGV
jgi:archaellum component FlaF (FlaF/FlaG flagellin family)